MSGAVLVLTLPLLAAVLVYLLRRWPPPSTVLAGLVALVLGLLLWRWPNDSPVVFLGRVVQANLPIILLGETLGHGVAGPMGDRLALPGSGRHLSRRMAGIARTQLLPFRLGSSGLFSAVLTIRPVWLAPVVGRAC